MVTPNLLQTFKERMHITHDAEDSILESLLSFSISAIKSKVGEFDITGEQETDKRATELVLERSRYAYNDAVEYFENNFLSQINSLALSIAMRGEENEEV